MLVSFLPLLSVTLMLQLFLVWGSPASSYLSVAEQVIQDLMFLPIWLLLQPKCFSPALSPKKEKKKKKGQGFCCEISLGKTSCKHCSAFLVSQCIFAVKALRSDAVKSDQNTSNKTKHLFNFIELRFSNSI